MKSAFACSGAGATAGSVVTSVPLRLGCVKRSAVVGPRRERYKGSMRSAALWLVIGAALASTAAAPAAAPRLESAHSCPDAAGFTCSTLVVPLDRSGNVAGTLLVAVAAANNTR